MNNSSATGVVCVIISGLARKGECDVSAICTNSPLLWRGIICFLASLDCYNNNSGGYGSRLKIKKKNFMKRMPKVSISALVIIGAIGILLLWGVISKKNVVRYVSNDTSNDTTEVVATSTEPAYPADWLEEAEKAKADVLRRKELEKENADLTNKIKELETRQAEIEKELGF